jgi:hypothetical protein
MFRRDNEAEPSGPKRTADGVIAMKALDGPTTRRLWRISRLRALKVARRKSITGCKVGLVG